jgi:hypothetical protein
MIRNEDPDRNLRSFVGTAMLIVGSAVLVAYSIAIAWQFYGASGSAESLGCLGSIGLASLHAFRLITLDHAALLSVVHRLLVLCSALIVSLIGVALLPKRRAGATAPGRRGVSAQPKGDQ